MIHYLEKNEKTQGAVPSLPTYTHAEMSLKLLESIFGWMYFTAWSATFYPQILLIFRRKTSAGISSDFMLINVVGFISYVIFTFASYTNSAVRESYKEHTGYPPQVDTWDVLFAGHGAIMCSVIIAEMFYYPPRTSPKTPVLLLMGSLQLVVIVGLTVCLVGKLDWYVYLSFAGMIKVLASLIKHFPQVWLNAARQSTVGWSFAMILLDVVGGLFSVMQQVTRCFRIHSLAPFTSNYTKTVLAAESLAFDFYFIAQHTIWYTDRTDIDKDITSSSLIPSNPEEGPLV